MANEFVNTPQREELAALRRALVAELERLEEDERAEGNPISAPGPDSVRDDRVAEISRQLAEIDTQLAQGG